MSRNRVMIICAGVALLFAVIMYKAHQEDKNFSSSVSKTEAIRNAPVKHYTDNGGTDHAEKQVAVADLAVIRKVYQHTIDSLAKLLNVKPKFIEEVVQVSTENKGSFKPVITTIDRPDTSDSDGTASIEVSYSDKWMNIRGVVNEDSSWTYSVTDSLSFTTYRKKTGFLKRDLFIDVFSHNPHTTVKGLTAIRIADAKPKKWAISLFAGYAWNGKAWCIAGGAGITRSIIRF